MPRSHGGQRLHVAVCAAHIASAASSPALSASSNPVLGELPSDSRVKLRSVRWPPALPLPPMLLRSGMSMDCMSLVTFSDGSHQGRRAALWDCQWAAGCGTSERCPWLLKWPAERALKSYLLMPTSAGHFRGIARVAEGGRSAWRAELWRLSSSVRPGLRKCLGGLSGALVVHCRTPAPAAHHL
jgi:hypothetical protein